MTQAEIDAAYITDALKRFIADKAAIYTSYGDAERWREQRRFHDALMAMSQDEMRFLLACHLTGNHPLIELPKEGERLEGMPVLSET